MYVSVPTFICTCLIPSSQVPHKGWPDQVVCLTPLIGGPVSFPPPSPNTTAFLNVMSSSAYGATITPNTLNAIAEVLASSNIANNANGSQPHPLSVSHPLPSGYEQGPLNYTNSTSTQSSDARFTSSAANTASPVTNDLFLLSQALRELTQKALHARWRWR